MTRINHRPIAINHNRKNCDGFTMVEVVIAGAILVATMTAVAQMGVSALAGNKNLSQRAGIEAAVNNDIQLLQQADSYLTYQSIDEAAGAQGSQKKGEAICPRARDGGRARVVWW